MFKLTPFTATPRRRDDFSDFDHLIDDFFRGSPLRSLRHDTFKIDVREEDNHYLIEADMPGVKKEEVKVSYDDQILTIAVEKKEASEDNQERYLHRERQFCSMKRSINLLDVDPQKVKARLDDGVLKIIAEKAEIKNTSYLIDVD